VPSACLPGSACVVDVGVTNQVVERAGEGGLAVGHHVLVAQRHVRRGVPMRSISSLVVAPVAAARVAAVCRTAHPDIADTP
jgi:hypothetical protein